MNAGTEAEILVRPTEAAREATVRALRALDENTRLARCTMLAIDQYVETMARFLTAGRRGPSAERRHATAQGLHRLREYLMRDAPPRVVSSSERDATLERERFGFVTTEGTPNMRARALEAGALFLLAKPFTPEDLRDTLEKAKL